jgi:hypothetical protein
MRSCSTSACGTADSSALDCSRTSCWRTKRIAPGLVCETVGEAPAVVVVENTDTLRSVADVLGEIATPPVGLIAWGAGAAFEQSCEALRTLQVAGRPLQRAVCFGDIDPSGLRIAARAAQLVAPLPLLPARPLYELLLDRDRRGSRRERLAESSEEHLAWLGERSCTAARCSQPSPVLICLMSAHQTRFGAAGRKSRPTRSRKGSTPSTPTVQPLRRRR